MSSWGSSSKPITGPSTTCRQWGKRNPTPQAQHLLLHLPRLGPRVYTKHGNSPASGKAVICLPEPQLYSLQVVLASSHLTVANALDQYFVNSQHFLSLNLAFSFFPSCFHSIFFSLLLQQSMKSLFVKR